MSKTSKTEQSNYLKLVYTYFQQGYDVLKYSKGIYF